ncbi:MAG: TonB-dependent receptor [Bacteroidetes bacterium]|nr:TonB-dependent receptor [Bacteroidota bacterium]
MRVLQYTCFSIFFFFTAFLSLPVFAQQEVNGIVRDAQSNDALPGVNVVIKGTQNGTVTDDKGAFSIKTKEAYPLTVVISYLGYGSQEITVKSAKRITVRLKSNEVNLKDVAVVGTRITEKQKESPLTVESMSRIGIKETPAVNFYDGLGELKGVDLTSASFGFKVLNTRGFNSTSPVRSLQLIDGVDNQSPGLNFSLGNFLGASELDVQKVEMIVGASSAYYGPNAFNGVISMTSRSPFDKPGLEVSLKAGEREMFEGALRWAQVLKNKKGEDKFGYKINLYYLRAKDWAADNKSATPQSLNGEHNPGGYDAVNTYGDEYINGTDFRNAPGSYLGLNTFYRRGYEEKDLVDYDMHNVKAGLAMHYKITPKTEAIIASNLGTGTTIYQGDNRYMLKDIWFLQNRIEVRHENKWFIRAYATNEDAGKSYDAYFTALQLQAEAKSNNDWVQDYENYWAQHYSLDRVKALPGAPPQPSVFGAPYIQWLSDLNNYALNNYYDSLALWHATTQAYANSVGDLKRIPLDQPFFEPGTHNFDTAFAGITSRKTYGQKGSMFYDHSALYHVQAEYKFNPWDFCEVTTGGNFRMYAPNSQGTIFADTNGVTIRNWELGLYAGVEKKFLNDKLKANATVRVDKNQNFPFLVSPAASVVYQPAKEQYVRVSFSSAIRNPTLADQYLYYQTGRAILIGNRNGFDNLVTVPSLIAAYDANLNFDSLKYFNVKPVVPEKVKTLEVGYRGTLFNCIYIDGSAYYSWYKDFIGYKVGVSIDTMHHGLIPDIVYKNAYRVATNSEDKVTTMGVAIGINYYIGKYFAVVGNYSYNKLDRHGSTDPLIPAYNTPEHKCNIGFNGRDIKNFGFNINYKWVQGFDFEGSPQFTGHIDSYGLVDVQVNRRFPRMYSTLKIGASNVLNNMHYEVYGGPKVGRIAYVSLLLELNKI